MKPPRVLQRPFRTVQTAMRYFSDDKVSLLAAALAYYTLFSIAPILIIALALAGAIFGEQASQGKIFAEIQKLVGTNGGLAIESMVRSASKPSSGGTLAAVLGVCTLILGAMGVFQQLQDALNLIWKVQVDVKASGLWKILRQRLLSFAMILVIAFLLTVSLIASAAIAAAGQFLGNRIPLGESIWQAVNIAFSFALTTALFGAIFKVLPDVRLRWRDVLRGAVLTALLFTIGKTLIGIYLGHTSVTSIFGAAGSLVIVMVWVFYSANILLLGAELTRAIVATSGRTVEPRHGATLLPPPNTDPTAARSRKRAS